MNKLAFFQGYSGLHKEAKSNIGYILKHIGVGTSLLGIPRGLGYLGGKVHGYTEAPSDREVRLIQARYVKSKLEQAIADLENKSKLEKLKESFDADKSTLRF